MEVLECVCVEAGRCNIDRVLRRSFIQKERFEQKCEDGELALLEPKGREFLVEELCRAKDLGME